MHMKQEVIFIGETMKILILNHLIKDQSFLLILSIHDEGNYPTNYNSLLA